MHDFDWASVEDINDPSFLDDVQNFINSFASADDLFSYVEGLSASNDGSGAPIFYAGLDFGKQSGPLADAGFRMLDWSQAQAFLTISDMFIEDRFEERGVGAFNEGNYSLFGAGDKSLFAAASRNLASSTDLFDGGQGNVTVVMGDFLRKVLTPLLVLRKIRSFS